MKILLFLIAFVLSMSIHASDYDREKRLADEIIDSIIDGDPVYLVANNHQFLSIYMESEVADPKGAVILLHGRGYHPNWKDVIYPLRTGLPDSGWHTLSIQMPVLTKDAKYNDYVPIIPESFPRIDAAVKFLEDKGINNIILIAHSCSVHMSMPWYDKTRSTEIKGYIGIGIGATDYKQPMLQPLPLDKFKIPVLDIYGSQEYGAVIKAAPERLKQIKSTGIKQSEQRVVEGANHYFTDKGGLLLDEINDWLNKLDFNNTKK